MRLRLIIVVLLAAICDVKAQSEYNYVVPNDGHIYSRASDGRGGWFIGGDFTLVNRKDRMGFAQIDSSGRVTDWNPKAGYQRPIYALVYSGSKLFVGTAWGAGFGMRDHFAVWDFKRDYYDSIIDITVDGSVNDILLSNGTIYIAGDFHKIMDRSRYATGNQTRNFLAAIDSATGLLKPWNPNPNGMVRTLAISGKTIFCRRDF